MNLSRIIYHLIGTVVPILLSASLWSQHHWNQPFALDKLNSVADDFAPVWNPVDSTFIFCSTRNGNSKFYQSDPEMLHALMYEQIDQGGRRQVSYMSVSKSGERMYSAFRSNGRQRVLNILASTRVNMIWSEPVFVEALLSESFSSHASLSPDGMTLVFASDRDGGEGGTDLWISTKTGSTWNQPMNLGESINSSGNEITPFLHTSDTLYFASNGLGGRGGYEVFVTTLIAGEWSPPVPLADINTSFDESDFCILPSGDAVFASNRPGTQGGLDLFLARVRH